MARDISCGPSLPIALAASTMPAAVVLSLKLRKKQNNLRQHIGKTNPIED
jgi:hypothetical protein